MALKEGIKITNQFDVLNKENLVKDLSKEEGNTLGEILHNK